MGQRTDRIFGAKPVAPYDTFAILRPCSGARHGHSADLDFAYAEPRSRYHIVEPVISGRPAPPILSSARAYGVYSALSSKLIGSSGKKGILCPRDRQNAQAQKVAIITGALHTVFPSIRGKQRQGL